MLYYATTMCVYNIYTVIIIIHSTIQTKEKKTLSLSSISMVEPTENAASPEGGSEKVTS